MHRRLSIATILTGVIAQLSGLVVDSVLHARDETLAAREGVLSLSNPGHLLIAGGLALTVLGASALLLAPLLSRRRRGMAGMALVALPVATMLALSAGAFAVAARSGSLTGRLHAGAAEDHSRGNAAAQRTTDTTREPASAHDHAAGPAQTEGIQVDRSRHQHGQEISISWEQLREIDGMLASARAATEKYRDVNAARADGYVQLTQVVPGLGAHFVHPGLMATGTFDIARPQILLYDHAAGGGFELVGVSWSLPKKAGDETPPFPYFGPLATWHYHTDLCFGLRSGGPVVSTGTAAGCKAAGGLFVKETGWMMHAWIFRPSPEGVFSHQNSTITGAPPAAARR